MNTTDSRPEENEDDPFGAASGSRLDKSRCMFCASVYEKLTPKQIYQLHDALVNRLGKPGNAGPNGVTTEAIVEVLRGWEVEASYTTVSIHRNPKTVQFKGRCIARMQKFIEENYQRDEPT